ncbi:hypothetical protein UFOVP733_5 [uncultured Caudovirales phage]|uniref:Uncharacterized protein n=1 Tax=uncultured Caudovirales phage TaxID=2100421 RepID=A0A6J7X2F3_9CAUD|nr:hypothetical protein UFOVP733_5 [uncultured Caudovirales phage]CAB5224973.1 hypothetical protein UFOVP743_54 [uncultured Caudovirales phage]
MQSTRSNVALQQKSTERVKKHREQAKKMGYKRKIYWVSEATEFKLKKYAALRKKSECKIIDDLMKNVF